MNILLNNENKKKFLVLTLCFTLVFTSINYKKSYADGGIISLPLLATVSALAVGTGILINNNDDFYDMGRFFVEYVKSSNQTMSDVLSLFTSSVKVMANGMISVGSDFLDIVKDFFDSRFDIDTSQTSSVGTYKGIPVYDKSYNSSKFYKGKVVTDFTSDFTVGEFNFKYLGYDSGFGFQKYQILRGSEVISSLEYINNSYNNYVSNFSYVMYGGLYYLVSSTSYVDGSYVSTTDRYINCVSSISSNPSIPYGGAYDWDNVNDRVDSGTGDLPLPIPGNVGNLVGQGSTDFWDNTDGLVGNGDLTAPNVDNPSIGLDGTTSFPNTGTGEGDVTIPNTGIWADIKAFVIGLVVPSDTFWVDTWGGLYNDFTSNFPMVDMGRFEDLIVDGKPFPNIDITIMGVKGRVVNGDTVNSIVDWLRPIIAGFMMLCLMFFNYRKIYKVIRNSEPFGGIAPGTSDFSTGIQHSSNIQHSSRVMTDREIMINQEGL